MMVLVRDCLRRNPIGECRLYGRRLMCDEIVVLSEQAIVLSKQSRTPVVSSELIVIEESEGLQDRESCRLKANDDLRGCWGGSGNLMARVLASRPDGSEG